MPRLNDTLYNAIDEAATGEAITFKKVTTYVDNTAMTDAKVDGVIYQKNTATGEYFKRTFSGLPRAKWFGIVGDGGSKSTLLNTTANYSHVRKLVLDSDDQPDVVMNANVNFQGKTLRFDGNKLKGTGTLSNVFVEAAPGVQIFDTSLTVSDVKNTTIFASWFGLLPGNTAAQNTAAIQKINSLVNMSGGGYVIVIDKGLYNVGVQVKNNPGAGFTNAYAAQPLFKFQSCTNVVIEGSGAVFKTVDGMKVGSWDSSNDTPYVPPAGYYADMAKYSTPGTMVDIRNCANITIRNIILDGNAQNFNVGGRWGSGFECGGIGIQAFDNVDLLIDNVIAKNQLTDGAGIVNSYLGTPNVAPQRTTLRNSQFIYNGRQGLSWDGGNHLHAENCHFSHTGQVFAGSTRIVSGPGGGIDIEPEGTSGAPYYCENGYFKNCFFEDNIGISFLDVGGDSGGVRSKNILIEGGKIENNATAAIWVTGVNFTFRDVTVVGTVIALRAASGYADPARTKFFNCNFSQQPGDYFRTVTVNDNTTVSQFAHQYALLDHCTFNLGNNDIFIADTELQDCKIKKTSTAESIVHGLHKGDISLTGTNFNLNAAIKQGRTFVNATLQAADAPLVGSIKFSDGTEQSTASTGGGGSAQYWTLTNGDVSRPTGKVGIGVASPDELLHIKTTAAGGGISQVRLEGENNGGGATLLCEQGSYGTILSRNWNSSGGAFLGPAIGDNSKASAVILGANSALLELYNFMSGSAVSKFKIDNAGQVTLAGLKLAALNTAPTSATAAGTLGEVRITADYIYVCIATNTWVRTALATW